MKSEREYVDKFLSFSVQRDFAPLIASGHVMLAAQKLLCLQTGLDGWDGWAEGHIWTKN